METTTHFLRDILRQPTELGRATEYLSGNGRPALEKAADALRNASQVYITGIGASWHAALNAGAIFYLHGKPVFLADASELLHFSIIPSGSVLVVLSRSGRSIEIVKLIEIARTSGATVVGITNSADGVLASESDIPIVVQAERDHGISVNTYSTLNLAACFLAFAAFELLGPGIVKQISTAIAAADSQMTHWRNQIEQSNWFAAGATYYFLARGTSLGSCHETRLLWEEGVKSSATSMGTGAFRHGPQETVREGLRYCLWIDAAKMRHEDLAVARDLRELGALVMLIGQDLPPDEAHLALQLPRITDELQSIVDIIPAQLAAEHLARLSQVDCDSFRVCSYVVESESGLLNE